MSDLKDEIGEKAREGVKVLEWENYPMRARHVAAALDDRDRLVENNRNTVRLVGDALGVLEENRKLRQRVAELEAQRDVCERTHSVWTPTSSG